jgi:hypothetical protein
MLKGVQSMEIEMEIGMEIGKEIWMVLKWKGAKLVERELQELMALQMW